MIKIKGTPLLILFFLFVSCAYAVKPAQVSDPSAVLSLSIVSPKIEYFKQNEEISLHFHVFNSNYTSIANNTGVCVFHLYDNRDKHIFQGTLERDSNAEEFKWTSSNTSRLGIYPYIIYCNTTKKEYGFLSDSFTITPYGREWNKPLNFSILGGYFVLIFIILYFAHKFRSDKGALIVYGVIGATLSFILAGLIFTQSLLFWEAFANMFLGSLVVAIGLYCFMISFILYKETKITED